MLPCFLLEAAARSAFTEGPGSRKFTRFPHLTPFIFINEKSISQKLTYLAPTCQGDGCNLLR
jgi:hypothetical protein